MERTTGPTRRSVVRVGGVGLVGAIGLAGCGSDEPADDETAGAEAEPEQDAGAGTQVPVADVPEGGSVFLPDEELIVTQPTAGEFAAYDSTCPHQGCAVSMAEGTEMVCPCHGSGFDIATGEVINGPATRGLTSLDVTLDGDSLTITS